MSLLDEYTYLAAGINPNKQVVCIHRGKVNAEGAPVVAPRIDPETGLPVLNVFLKTQLPDVLLEGWEVFTPPPTPQGIRPAQRNIEEDEETTTTTTRRRRK